MKEWRVRTFSAGAETQRWELLDAQGRTLTFDDVVRGWREREDFRLFWCSSLRNAPFDAYAWECPPVTANTLSRDFDCVFVASPLLARMPADSQAFAEHFRPDQSVATFANLGGDAVLVAPSPADGGDNYSHLASFVATAPASQQDALWKAVGEACNRRIGTKPVWISTAGLGVGWLHVRLDDRPKYYRHTPYMSVPAVLVHP
jgi:hypothetical protein